MPCLIHLIEMPLEDLWTVRRIICCPCGTLYYIDGAGNIGHACGQRVLHVYLVSRSMAVRIMIEGYGVSNRVSRMVHRVIGYRIVHGIVDGLFQLQLGLHQVHALLIVIRGSLAVDGTNQVGTVDQDVAIFVIGYAIDLILYHGM